MRGSVLVIGGRVAGIRAASELLQQGFRVYLLEAGPEIGGLMRRIDRLPPTGEHASCAWFPLTFELVNNPSATVLTSSELISLDGRPGEFTATVVDRGSTNGARTRHLSVGAVVVATGPEERSGKHLSRLGHDGPGVFVCGTVEEAESLGASVIQACAAAARASAFLAPTRDGELTTPAVGDLLAGRPAGEPRIGVVIEREENEFAALLDFDDLAEEARSLPGVERVDVTPSASIGQTIEHLLSTTDCNRLVVAGPSPITHEVEFRDQVERTGLNRHLLEMVNLYNHSARVHAGDKVATTRKAAALMKMGVVRLRRLEPLDVLRVGVTQSCLVIGASAAGVACAATLATMGLEVHLVHANDEVAAIPGRVTVHAAAEVEGVRGGCGDFEVRLAKDGAPEEVTVGAIVVTAGIGDGVAESLGLEKEQNGLYLSTEGILNPLDGTRDGVFICGPVRAPGTTEDAVIEGEAAASRAACILSSPVLERPPVISSVVDQNCDGCAYCVSPCPTRSITLLEFIHEDATKKVVEVSDRTCIGCGICMATCPKEGIFVRNYDLDTFEEMVATALEADFQPLIVCFCCNRCAYPGTDAAALAGHSYPPGVLIIRTVCAGMIHPNIITNALTQGADGVLLCGCHPGECRSREGIRRAQDRAETLELLLEDFGLEQERFRLESIAASEGAKFARLACEMSAELDALGPSPYQRDR